MTKAIIFDLDSCLAAADEVGEHSRKRPAPPGCGYDDSGREHGADGGEDGRQRLPGGARRRLRRNHGGTRNVERAARTASRAS